MFSSLPSDLSHLHRGLVEGPPPRPRSDPVRTCRMERHCTPFGTTPRRPLVRPRGSVSRSVRVPTGVCTSTLVVLARFTGPVEPDGLVSRCVVHRSCGVETTECRHLRSSGFSSTGDSRHSLPRQGPERDTERLQDTEAQWRDTHRSRGEHF